MSIESSDLLSEGTLSEGEGESGGKKSSFSFHQYLDDVAGSDDGSNDSSAHDVLIQTESGLSYDESVAKANAYMEDASIEDFEIAKMKTKDTNNDSDQDSTSKDDQKMAAEYNTHDDDTAELRLPAPQLMSSLSKEEIEMVDPEATFMETDADMQSPPRLNSMMTGANLHSPISTLSHRTTPPSSAKRVRMSPLTKMTPSKRVLATPPRKGKQSPPRSKRPKIISPFSPRARKMRVKQPSAGQQVEFSSQVQWSMAPSRKVSILVNVSPHLNACVSSSDEENTLCLYPNVPPDDGGSGNASLSYSPARSIRSSYSVTSQSSILNKAGPGQELILVNPSAFGDFIPTSITVETARVVQQFSNKASEDWVRKFKFDEVCWPDVKQLIGIKKQNTNSTMEDVARATVADVINGKSTVFFGYGVRHSGRLESMFGSIAGEIGIDPLSTIGGRKSIGLELGLFGLIVSKLLDKQKGEMKQMTFKVSIVEILDEDVVRDLLQKSLSGGSSILEKSIKIRHPDNKGAIIENTTEVTIGTLADVKKAVKRAFHSKNNRKERKLVGGRGHIVATVHVFPDGEKIPQKDGKKNFNYPLLQLVDLACAETEQVEQEKATGRTKIQMTKVQNKRVSCIRQSMAGLGAILRRLVVDEVQHMPQSSMYRACTLTKLFQRAMDNPKSRGVMISTVCPRRDSYKRTLRTLTYMHRLLVKPSKTAESPFENKEDEFEGQSFGGHHFFSPGDHSIAYSVAQSVASSAASEAIRSEFAHARGNRAFMKSLVTDPRQRLATLLSPKENPDIVGSHSGLPITEITTINEVDNDAGDDDELYTLEVSQRSTSIRPDDESLESSVVADLSHDRLSALSDELNFDGSRDETFDTSLQSDPDTAKEKNVTFDKVLAQLDEIDVYNEDEVLAQLDEIDVYNEDDESDYLISEDEESVESLEPLDMSQDSKGAEDEEKEEVIDNVQKGIEPEGEMYEPIQNAPAIKLISPSIEIDEVVTSVDVPNHEITNTEENQAHETEDPNETEMSLRRDPSGKHAEELSDQRILQAHHAIQTSQKKDAFGRDGPGGDARSQEERSYDAFSEQDEFTQSPVSTMTPYDIMTRDDESESYQSEDDQHSMSSEESFPRNVVDGQDRDGLFPRHEDDMASDESFPCNNNEATTREMPSHQEKKDLPLKARQRKEEHNRSGTEAFELEGERQSSSTSSRKNHYVGENTGVSYDYPPGDLFVESSDASSSNDSAKECLQDDEEIQTSGLSRFSMARGRESLTISKRKGLDPDASYEADTYEQRVSVRNIPSPNQAPLIGDNRHISSSTENRNIKITPAILSDYQYDDSPEDSQDFSEDLKLRSTRDNDEFPVQATDKIPVRPCERGQQKAGVATNATLFQSSDKYASNTNFDDGKSERTKIIIDKEETDQGESSGQNTVSHAAEHAESSAQTKLGLPETRRENSLKVKEGSIQIPSVTKSPQTDTDAADVRCESRGKVAGEDASSTDQSNLVSTSAQTKRCPSRTRWQNREEEYKEFPSVGTSDQTDTNAPDMSRENEVDFGGRADSSLFPSSNIDSSTQIDRGTIGTSHREPFEVETSPTEQSTGINEDVQADRNTSDLILKSQVGASGGDSQIPPRVINPHPSFPSADQHNLFTRSVQTETISEKEGEGKNSKFSSHLSVDGSIYASAGDADRKLLNDLDCFPDDQSESDSFSAKDNLQSSDSSIEDRDLAVSPSGESDDKNRLPVTKKLLSSVANLSEKVQDELKRFKDPASSNPIDKQEHGDTKTSTSETKSFKTEAYLETPSRKIKRSVVHKVKSLVSRSDALRAYSPDGKIDPRKSLENYKAMLKDSLNALDGELECSSIGGLSSDDEDADDVPEATAIEFKSYSPGLAAGVRLSYPASDDGSSDVDSLAFDPVPSEEIQSDVDNISLPRHSRRHGQNQYAGIPLPIRSEIERLQETLKVCIDSTNESELITELAEDKFDITDFFNPDEEPIMGTIKQMKSQTEALQTFINSTLDQLQESRTAERTKQLEIMETNLRLEETLDEIQGLKSSNRLSIDQINQDHLDTLNAASEKEARLESAAKEEMERKMNSTLSMEQNEKCLLQQTVFSLETQIKDMKVQLMSSSEEQRRTAQSHTTEVSSLVEALDSKNTEQESKTFELRKLVKERESQFQEQKSHRQRAEDSLESERAAVSNAAEKLKSEHKTQSTLKEEIRHLESRLADEISVSKDTSSSLKNEIISTRDELQRKSKAHDDLLQNIESVKGLYEQKSRIEQDTLEQKIITLQGRLGAEERDKDILEDRLTDEVTSLQHLLDRNRTANSDLIEALDSMKSEFEDRMNSDQGEKQHLLEEIKKLQECATDELSAKQELEESLSLHISKLSKELDGNVKTNEKLEGILELAKSEFDEQKTSERKERSLLDDKIVSLQDALEKESREKDDMITRFTTDASILESDLNIQKYASEKLEEDLKAMQSEYNENMESECHEKYQLSGRIDELEELLKDAEDCCHRTRENSNMRISELQDVLIEKKMTNSELDRVLKEIKSQYEEESSLRAERDQMIDDLEERLLQAASGNDKIESELMERVKTMGEGLKVKSEENTLLQDKFASMTIEFLDRLKLEGVEKASLEDEIKTLQERLKEEAQERDDDEARLSSKVNRMKDELASTKRHNDNLGNALEEARNDFESTTQLFNSEKSANASLEESNTVLRQRMEEESKVSEELKSRLSEELLAQEEEIQKKLQENKDLINEFSDLKEKEVKLNNRLESENINKIALESELSTMQLHHDQELRDRQEQEQLLGQNIKSLENDLKEKSKESSELSQKVKSVKKEHNQRQKKLVEDLTERIKEKATSESQISALELEASDRSKQIEGLNQALATIRDENEGLKDHLKAGIERTSLELTERMEEKASYEAANSTLEVKLEESYQERDRLKEDISTSRNTFVELQDRLAAEITERSRQEDSYLSRIEYLENALNDCCKGKEELYKGTRKIEEEREILNRNVESLTSEKDALQQQAIDNRNEIEALEQEVSNTENRLDEVQNESRSTREYLEDLEAENDIAAKEFAKNAAKWESKLVELSTKLAQEITYRLDEKTNHAKEIGAIAVEADEQRQELLCKINVAEEMYTMLQEETKSELERMQSIHTNDETVIADLTAKSDEQDRESKEMENNLEQTNRTVLSLNERVADMSEEHSQITGVHTKTITTLTHTIQEKDEKISVQAEDTIELQEEIERLYHSSKEEIESKIKSDKSHFAEVSKLQQVVSTKNKYIEEIASQLTEQKSDMDITTDKLAKETEAKKYTEKGLHEAQQNVQNLRDGTSDLRKTIQSLGKDLAKSKKEIETQREEKDQAEFSLLDSKRAYEEEKSSLQEAFDTKEKELQRFSTLVHKMEESAENKAGFIADLENTVDELKVMLESEITKVYTLSAIKASNDDERKRLAQDIISLNDKLSQENTLKSSLLAKLQTSLDSKASKNKKLKDALNNTHQDNEDLRKSMGEALEESNDIRKELSEMLQRTKEDLTARIHELEEDKRSGDAITQNNLGELSTRISDLSIMKETLKSENKALLENNQEEKQLREKVLKKNKQLKTALALSETKVREEMKELEFTMHTTISKIESKRKKAIEGEKVKISLTIDKLEDENDAYKIKITQLESIIRRLERQSSMGIRGHSEGSASRDESDGLRNENDRLHKRIRILEKNETSFSSTTEEYRSHHRRTPGRGDKSPGADGSDSDYYVIEYRLERERRIKAEEFAAAMAARAKAGFEERNEDIIHLRMKVSSLESEREKFDHQRQLMLTDSATSQSPTELLLAIQERDEALEEVNRYKFIACKLNEQVVTMNEMIEETTTDAVSGGL